MRVKRALPLPSGGNASSGPQDFFVSRRHSQCALRKRIERALQPDTDISGQGVVLHAAGAAIAPTLKLALTIVDDSATRARADCTHAGRVRVGRPGGAGGVGGAGARKGASTASEEDARARDEGRGWGRGRGRGRGRGGRRRQGRAMRNVAAVPALTLTLATSSVPTVDDYMDMDQHRWEPAGTVHVNVPAPVPGPVSVPTDDASAEPSRPSPPPPPPPGAQQAPAPALRYCSCLHMHLRRLSQSQVSGSEEQERRPMADDR